MKLYIHEGPGHYIGSSVIVIADNSEIAEELIRKSLNNMGLYDEKLSIIEKNIISNEVIYELSGDY